METLSPGARADAPGERRLRSTRPSPGATLPTLAETPSPGERGAEVYPASPPGQHSPLRPRPRPREHRPRFTRPARPPPLSVETPWLSGTLEERPRSLGRQDAGRNRLPGRQRAPSSRGGTLAGCAGGCPGRTPPAVYPASLPGQHCPLRPRHCPRVKAGRGLPGLPAPATSPASAGTLSPGAPADAPGERQSKFTLPSTPPSAFGRDALAGGHPRARVSLPKSTESAKTLTAGRCPGRTRRP